MMAKMINTKPKRPDAAHTEDVGIEDSLAAARTGHQNQAYYHDKHANGQKHIVFLVKCKIVHCRI